MVWCVFECASNYQRFLLSTNWITRYMSQATLILAISTTTDALHSNGYWRNHNYYAGALETMLSTLRHLWSTVCWKVAGVVHEVKLTYDSFNRVLLKQLSNYNELDYARCSLHDRSNILVYDYHSWKLARKMFKPFILRGDTRRRYMYKALVKVHHCRNYGSIGYNAQFQRAIGGGEVATPQRSSCLFALAPPAAALCGQKPLPLCAITQWWNGIIIDETGL